MTHKENPEAICAKGEFVQKLRPAASDFADSQSAVREGRRFNRSAPDQPSRYARRRHPTLSALARALIEPRPLAIAIYHAF
ncbi:unnamed protein product [Toxocara canis]|uniref:Transcriptional regulator n=1 Tax=Toxocara canis TaxID=6265 RepID=A0A183UDP3_TOXCA|nr:unnamed protein product [Toxocara canis]